ncbi:MAG: hypothetical protein GY944_04795 [bacterium]|nr:hypothetical protein [bacterium]
MTTATRYNDNVTNVAKNKDDAFGFELGPTLRMASRADKFEGEVNYRPRFVKYTSGRRSDEFDQSFSLEGEYRPTQRLTFGLRDSLAHERDSNRDFDDSGLASFSLGKDDKQTLRNRLAGTARYGLSPRVSLSSDVSYNIVERDDRDLSDLTDVSGAVQANYQATARQAFGGGARGRHQLVEGAPDGGRVDTRANYYGLSAFWSYRFTPLISLSLNAGPTWVMTERDGLSGAEAKKDDSLEYFGNVELNAEYERGVASIAYQRSGSDFAFTSNAYLIHLVSAEASWAVTEKVVLGISGEWNERDAILEGSDGPQFDKIQQWRAATTASLRLTRELVGAITLDYQRQATDGDGQGPASRYRAMVRLTYNARSFRF